MGEIADVQTPVMDWAERHGWIARRIQYIGRRACPDAMFARGSIILLVEFKKTGAPYAAHQERERLRFAERGVRIHKIDTPQDGIALLKSYVR